jgi:hypothetical protein
MNFPSSMMLLLSRFSGTSSISSTYRRQLATTGR